MDILRKLGFRRNWIYETIVTTKVRGKLNSAPIGVWTDDFKTIHLEVYKTNRTCDNILKKKEFVINLPKGIGIFYESMFKEGEPDIPGKSDVSLKMRVLDVKDLGDRVRILSEIADSEIRGKPKLVNRAEHLALESLIAYSKLPFVSGKEKEFLEEKIRDNYRVICKSAPGSGFQGLVRGLLGV